jgi:hypothetical protein
MFVNIIVNYGTLPSFLCFPVKVQCFSHNNSLSKKQSKGKNNIPKNCSFGIKLIRANDIMILGDIQEI